MASPHDLDFMIKNPLCSFCNHSYYKFFHEWCSKKNDCRNLCAKSCEYYDPNPNKKEKTVI